MTLASWFSSVQHSRRRLTQTGARRNRSRAFDRSASFEALEDRFLLSTVSFSTGSETVNESSRHVQHPGHALESAHRHPHRLQLRLRDQRSRRPGLRRRRQPLRRRLPGNDTVDKVTPAGVVSTFATGFDSDPDGLAFDSAGNLYVANYGDGTVRRGDARGRESAPSPPGSTTPTAWPSTRPATSTSPTPATAR